MHISRKGRKNMGYYANGNGWAKIKENEVDNLKKALEAEEFKDILYDINIDYSRIKGEKSYDDIIDFSENDSHWHEKDTMMFLAAMVPYITEGEAFYSGEDSCEWRYKFDSDKAEWNEESGTTYYCEEDMIKELERAGYIVKKKSVDIIDRNDYIATKLWSEEDVRVPLDDRGISYTDETVAAIINTGILKGLGDCTDNDWAIVDYAIDEGLKVA